MPGRSNTRTSATGSCPGSCAPASTTRPSSAKPPTTTDAPARHGPRSTWRRRQPSSTSGSPGPPRHRRAETVEDAGPGQPVLRLHRQQHPHAEPVVEPALDPGQAAGRCSLIQHGWCQDLRWVSVLKPVAAGSSLTMLALRGPIEVLRGPVALAWRARCGESRTTGSAGGPGKRNSGNAVTAPRADPTGGTPAAATST
jgi:hypothetical protein